MIKEKTLFILGAGASMPYGFPSANGLKKQICAYFSGKYIQLLKKRGDLKTNALNLYRSQINDFIIPFSRSTVSSIDLYLKRRDQFSAFGKQAIILSILEAEGNSRFADDIPDNKKHTDWYTYIFEALTEDIKDSKNVNEIFDNSVKFLTFNYDRSFENFLVKDIWSSFNNITNQDAIAIVKKLNIEHVFGSLPIFEGDSVAYGKQDITIEDLEKYFNYIKTIYEVDNNNKYKNIIKWAERIFILGFGFAKENLDVLGLPQLLSKDQKVYATALGLSKRIFRNTVDLFYSNWINKQDKVIRNYYGKDHYLKNFLKIEPEMDSVKLLDEYL